MPHALPQLRAELAAAGIAVPALGSYTDDSGAVTIHTYSDKGEIVPLPKAAAKVVKAHVPQPTPREAALALLRASDDPETRALLTVLGLA